MATSSDSTSKPYRSQYYSSSSPSVFFQGTALQNQRTHLDTRFVPRVRPSGLRSRFYKAITRLKGVRVGRPSVKPALRLRGLFKQRSNNSSGCSFYSLTSLSTLDFALMSQIGLSSIESTPDVSASTTSTTLTKSASSALAVDDTNGNGSSASHAPSST
ncbi:unnamed protein product [Somion occarium]|uniref:Uncharacterized protein n=1 Tax=Somion occarium TaxID=3059160 RepID=A0ABP1DD58_9APHY